jgi:hypothetical protein
MLSMPAEAAITGMTRAAPAASPVAAAPTGRFVTALFLLYAFSTIIDGVLRYILVNVSVPVEVLYGRDLALAVTAAAIVLARIRQREGMIFLVLALAAALHGVIGWSSTHSAAQVFFGFKVLIIIGFGAIAARDIDLTSRTARRWLLVFWLITVFGVVLSAVIELPWSGLVYSVGDIDVEASRSWSNEGIGRAAGFSRFSFSASIQVALLSLFLITTAQSRLRQIAVFAVGLAAIYLTDAKGSLVAFIVASLLFWCFGHRQLVLLKATTCMVALIVVLLPIVLPGLHVESSVGHFNVLRSFVERLVLGWPDAWTLIFHNGHGLLGRGIGGIGSAQRLFAPSFYVPCDNLFLFLFGYFGLFAPIYLGMPVIRLLQLPPQTSARLRFAAFALLYLLTYGAVVSILEDQFAGIFLGLVIGTLAAGGKGGEAIPPMTRPALASR